MSVHPDTTSQPVENKKVLGTRVFPEEWLTKELPPLEWVVDGFIPKGTINFISGRGGIGKSYILMELGLALAQGRPFLRHFPVSRQYKVLYLDLEMTERQIIRRIGRMVKGEEAISPGLNEFLDIRTDLHIKVQPNGQPLVDLIGESGAEIVLVDSLLQAFRTDSKDQDAPYKFFDSTKDIKNYATLIFLAHWRKPIANGGKEINNSGDALKGPAAWRDVIDQHIACKQGKKPDSLILEPEKCRDMDETHPQFVVEWSHTDPDIECGPFRMIYEEDVTSSSLMSRILNHLKTTGSPQTASEIQSGTKISHTSFYRIMENLLAKGMVVKTFQNKKTYFSPIP